MNVEGPPASSYPMVRPPCIALSDTVRLLACRRYGSDKRQPFLRWGVLREGSALARKRCLLTDGFLAVAPHPSLAWMGSGLSPPTPPLTMILRG